MQNDSRFGVYLIPPYPVSRDISESHTLLHKQFGLAAGSRFQVHCTIKGFFKKTAVPQNEIIARLDPVFKSSKPVSIYFSGFRINDIGIGLDISKMPPAKEKISSGQKMNSELLELRQNLVSAIKPFIAPDCDFSEADLEIPFHAHITLAMADIPQQLLTPVIEWLDDAPIPMGSFIAKDFHFLEFFSQDWSGPWWQTLTWILGPCCGQKLTRA